MANISKHAKGFLISGRSSKYFSAGLECTCTEKHTGPHPLLFSIPYESGKTLMLMFSTKTFFENHRSVMYSHFKGTILEYFLHKYIEKKFLLDEVEIVF